MHWPQHIAAKQTPQKNGSYQKRPVPDAHVTCARSQVVGRAASSMEPKVAELIEIYTKFLLNCEVESEWWRSRLSPNGSLSAHVSSVLCMRQRLFSDRRPDGSFSRTAHFSVANGPFRPRVQGICILVFVCAGSVHVPSCRCSVPVPGLVAPPNLCWVWADAGLPMVLKAVEAWSVRNRRDDRSCLVYLHLISLSSAAPHNDAQPKR